MNVRATRNVEEGVLMTNVPASRNLYRNRATFVRTVPPIEKKTYARTLRNCCSSRIPIENVHTRETNRPR